MKINNKAQRFLRNCFRGYFIIQLAIIFVLFSISLSFAGNVTFIKEYTYQASELDSKASCRTISLEMVKRLLLEELGTYLISETEVKDFKLTKEQVKTYSAGIVGAEIIEDKWDGKTYWLKAKVSADPKEVAKSIKSIGEDKQKKKELEEVRKKAKDALVEIESLKKEMEGLKKSTKKQEEYAKAVKELSATDWYEKGYNFYKSGNYKESINAYSKAIQLNPQYAEAYHARGAAYYFLRKYQQAINDSNKAIQLNPHLNTYLIRGVAYSELGNHQQLINDYNKAIQLDPQDAEAYHVRGIAYRKLGKYQQAINDYNKAIQLNPLHAGVYYNRGLAYGASGNNQQAIADFKIAARLDYKPAQDTLLEMGEKW